MCAAPTAPTLTSLVTTALKNAGYANPGTTELARGEDEFMEDIKNDIFIESPKMKSLHITANLILTNGKSRYAMPTDYSSSMTLNLLFGNNTGAAQAGSAGTITLAATEAIVVERITGRQILITSGEGKASMSQCIAYNATTKVATVSPDFTVAPDATSSYMIIDTSKRVVPDTVWGLDKIDDPSSQGEPFNYHPIGDADDGEFILYKTPYRNDSKVYGLQCRYYANLMKLDLDGTLMATLYQRWRNVWIAGVYAKQLMVDDDDRASRADAKYRALLIELESREIYGMDFSELQMTVDEPWRGI